MGRFDFFMVEIPELHRERTIRVYLPDGYDRGRRRYPVVYMHDGQNLYHSEDSAYGDIWNAQAASDRLREKGMPVIVVGIDNGGEERLDEYSPWICPPADKFEKVHGLQWSFGGKGVKYGEFIVKTLKPLIDDKYRTKPGRKSTAIMGSSMGGYISIYIGTKYSDVFSMVGAMSTSVWVEEKKLMDTIRESRLKYPMKWYLDVGTNEAGDRRKRILNRGYVDGSVRVYGALREKGLSDDDVRLLIDDGAFHNEKEWAKRLPEALEFLFGLSE